MSSLLIWIYVKLQILTNFVAYWHDNVHAYKLSYILYMLVVVRLIVIY